MNVYWAGGEDIDFTLTGSVVGSASAGAFDGNLARACVAVTGVSAAWPMATSAATQSFGNRSSFWAHASFVAGGGNGTTSGNIVIALADAGGVGRILVRGTGTAGQLKISSRNAAGTIVDFAGAVTAANAFTMTICKIDLFVNYATAGQVQLYINGVLVADTGAGVNVTTDGATSLSFLYFGLNGSGATADWSQVIVADSDTRNASLWTLSSSTAGNTQTWTGTASSVNKATISDTTFISAASAGLIEEFKTGGIALPAGIYSVAAVTMSSRAFGGSAGGPTRIEYVTRIGSTDYVGGTWTPPVGSFGNNSNFIQATNPATGLPWTTADLTAATFNYGIESVA